MRDVLSLSEDQWARCSELFEQLRGLPASVQDARLQEMHAQPQEDPDVLKLVARQLQDQHFLEFERNRTGEWIAGKYQLGTQIGSGGMGVVYRATRHLTKDARPSEVAVKLIRPAFLLTEQQAAMERFQREIAILQGLQHQHIAHCYDSDFHTDARSGDKMLFMATELVREGRPLTRYAQDYKLTVQACLEKFLEVCEAVLAMHTQRPPVIHGDLTPNNILVDQYHHLYVIDFGLAQVCDPARWRSGEPCIAGTLPYMSPEQLLEGRVTLQSDVYSLGIILYELLVGRRPYEVPHTASEEALRQAIRAEYRALDQRELDQIVTKALAIDLAQRYTSVAESLTGHREAAAGTRHERGYARGPTPAGSRAKGFQRKRARTEPLLLRRPESTVSRQGKRNKRP